MLPVGHILSRPILKELRHAGRKTVRHKNCNHLIMVAGKNGDESI